MAAKKGNRYFVWIIMVLLFVGLMGFGTGSLTGTIRSVGDVGDKSISVTQYQRALSEQMRAFEAQINSPLSFPQAQQIGLDQAVLSQVVSERTLDNETAQLGLSVGDARVREEVLRVPAFRGLDGEFDREAYRFALQQSGLSEAEFETGIREEIARTLLQGAVVGGIPAPAAYADALVQYIGEERSITWATVTAENLSTPVPGPTDEDLQTYYDANPDAFTQPEVRNITYAMLTPDMIQDQVAVDDTAVRELYDERIDEFVQPERRLVERLVFADKDTADAAAAQLDAGAMDFDTLVSERGLDLSDVDMGDVTDEDLGPASEAVFAAEPGDVVGPIETSLGPALFRMNAILAAEEITFEEAEPDLRAELAADRARRVIADDMDKINDLLAGGAGVADLAEQTDLTLGTIAWSADTSDDIAAYEAFRDVAANVSEGDFPTLHELDDGGIFVIELDSITPPALQPLADVRDAVADAWQRDRTQEVVLEEAQKLADQIQPLTGFDTLGLTPQQVGNLTRRSFVEGTPPTFLADVFGMKVGEVKVIDGGTNAIIVRLDDTAPPAADDPQTSAQAESVAETAAAGIAQDIYAVFSAQVQQRTDVQINQAAVNAVHATFQ